MRFLTFEARVAFIHRKKMFTKALILYQFDPKCHILIETDVFGFAIGEILNQLTLGYMSYTNPSFSTFKMSQ